MVEYPWKSGQVYPYLIFFIVLVSSKFKFMIFTKDEITKRVGSDRNIINQIKDSQANTIVIKRIGVNNELGNPGTKHLTEEEKVSIGVLANLEGRTVAAEMFGISKQYTSDLKAGLVHGNTGPRRPDKSLQEQIKERVESTKLTAQERAAERLLKSLGCLTDDKLDNADVKTASQVAIQMSQIVRNLSTQQDQGKGAGTKVNVVLMQPKATREESFDVIELGVSS